MRIIKAPPTSRLFMTLGILGALAVTYLIVQLVFTFGWFASGLAVEKADEERRRDAPIDVQFSTAPPPQPAQPAQPADPND